MKDAPTSKANISPPSWHQSEAESLVKDLQDVLKRILDHD